MESNVIRKIFEDALRASRDTATAVVTPPEKKSTMHRLLGRWRRFSHKQK